MASIPRFNVTGRYRMYNFKIITIILGEGEQSAVKNGSRFFASGDTSGSNLTRADDNKGRPNSATSQVMYYQCYKLFQICRYLSFRFLRFIVHVAIR